MEKSEPGIFMIGISSPSGGGKTTVTRKVVELLEKSAAIYFDDYDYNTIHPEDFKKWLDEGADCNAWKMPRFRDDLRRLKAGEAITSPVDGSQICPQAYIVIEAPLGYEHAETAEYIDFMVFIDTPLDVAMARRLLRDFPLKSSGDPREVAEGLRAELAGYLEIGRRAYLEMDNRVKPGCDLVLDGCLPVDELGRKIVEAIRASVRRSESATVEPKDPLHKVLDKPPSSSYRC